jgi:hypothetical protein
LVLALCAAGCGSGNLAGPTEQFVGTWQYDGAQASGSLTCGISTIDETPRGNRVFATGVDAPLVDLTASDLDSAINCNFRFDVAGPVATARTDQTCALTGAKNIIAFNPPDAPPKDASDAWTFTLLSATAAEENVRATLIVYQTPTQIGDPPTMAYCDYQMMARLVRVSKD